eukprot:TRINITY_DN44974_c0_g1_i2.p1 TRINITY_DN44974_c0_g1~~TRINITY_DN44974_c0_g1_i2.p1  ORF type:complete len:334 (+),score=88.70 TRINITY_DN44974_c0_g1_i2:103-1104(+)
MCIRDRYQRRVRGGVQSPLSTRWNMSDSEATPTSTTSSSAQQNMEVLTPRINALRSSMSRNLESSANRKGRKTTIEGADKDHRRSLIEGLVTARRSEKPRRSSVPVDGGGVAGVPLEDFESFKRTIEARMQALEEALEQKDEEVDALQAKVAELEGNGPVAAKSPPKNTSSVKVSAIPALNLGGPSSKKLPKLALSPMSAPTASETEQKPTSSGVAGAWKVEDVALFLGQLGVFKLWTASMVCQSWRSTACTIVLHQKRDQLRSGAEPALAFHTANPEQTEELSKMLPPLFQAGGPYHTLGLAGFVKIQELLGAEVLHLKDLYKFMRDITRRK